MFLNSFFEITHTKQEGDSITSRIRLNALHKIYEGHFPCNPVTPGVMLMQMVKEVLGNVMQKDFQLISMSRCKFLKVLNPIVTPEINIVMDVVQTDELLKVNASGLEGDEVFFKLSAVYK